MNYFSTFGYKSTFKVFFIGTFTNDVFNLRDLS